MDGNTGHHLTEDTSRVIINKNGLEYIRAHVSERTKNRKSNPRGREVGTLLGPSVLFCRISLTHYLRGVAQFGRALALGASGRRFKSFHPDLHTYYNYALLFCGILARELGNFDGQGRERRDNRCGEYERR